MTVEAARPSQAARHLFTLNHARAPRRPSLLRWPKATGLGQNTVDGRPGTVKQNADIMSVSPAFQLSNIIAFWASVQ